MEYKGVKLTSKILITMTVYVLWGILPLALLAFGGMWFMTYIKDPWQLAAFGLMLMGITLWIGKESLKK